MQPCPVCTTPHEEGSGNFCEICGYNFLTGSEGEVPFPISIPPVNMQSSVPIKVSNSATGVPKTATGQWQAIVSIDPSLASPESPPAPTQATMTIELTNATNLIGRTSHARVIHPEISVDLDDAVSSRHAILTLHPDGALVLRDIGSANGTMVNGKQIAMMADIPIRSGDEITLGHWTRIKLVSS
jgi:pSer/pThr/pTyr-binding forkhead associated (FHA) protein